MPGYPLPLPKSRFFDADGEPLVGGLVYVYEAGTTTPATTYADQALSTPNANPVVLDANGEATIFVPDADTQTFKIVLKDADGVQQWSVDGVSVPATAAPAAPAAVPTGAILPYGGAAAPTGYLLCDGSAVSRTTYAALFTAIGDAYGVGDGSTTFNVPDLRGRFPLGKAASGTGDTLGATGGSLDHVHSGPSHTHTVAGHVHTIAHTHDVPYDGWSTAVNGPPAAGVLQAGGAGSGSETSVTQATADQATSASSAANSGSTALTSDASGTGDTGTANPAFAVVQYIVKT